MRRRTETILGSSPSIFLPNRKKIARFWPCDFLAVFYTFLGRRKGGNDMDSDSGPQKWIHGTVHGVPLPLGCTPLNPRKEVKRDEQEQNPPFGPPGSPAGCPPGPSHPPHSGCGSHPGQRPAPGAPRPLSGLIRRPWLPAGPSTAATK